MKKTNYERDLHRAKTYVADLQKNITSPKTINGTYIKARQQYEGMKAIVKHINETVPSFSPEAAKAPWDAIEIRGVNMSWYKVKGEIKFDCCAVDDDKKDVYFYSVYLHQVEGAVQCIADVHTEQQARDLANLLQHSVKNYKDNGHLDKEF